MDHDDRLFAYMQNRLEPSDRAAFEAEIAGMPELQSEVAALRAAADMLGAEAVPASAQAEGWERLSASIAAESRGRPANTNRALSFLKVASVAAIAVIAWQFAVVPRLPTDPGFVPATEVAAGPALRVAFAPDTPMEEVTALLMEIGATVADGPSAVGLYTLGFADAATRDAAESLLADTPLVIVFSRP